jgi:hypothetical protein
VGSSLTEYFYGPAPNDLGLPARLATGPRILAGNEASGTFMSIFATHLRRIAPWIGGFRVACNVLGFRTVPLLPVCAVRRELLAPGDPVMPSRYVFEGLAYVKGEGTWKGGECCESISLQIGNSSGF